MPPLTEYQKEFLAKKKEKALLVYSTGCFKTRTAIEWAKMWGGTTLFVCPKGLKQNIARELKKWGGVADIVSKEEFKLRPQKKYDNLVIDECDYFFAPHFKSALSKSLKHYLDTHKSRLCMLSATPMRSSPWNIYIAGRVLGRKWDYKDFRDVFFFPVEMYGRTIWMAKTSQITKEKMRRTIANIGEVIRREDHFSIPEQSYETVYIDPDSSQEKAKNAVTTTHPLARFIADHRAESMNKYKFEAVERYAAENEKLAVICRYHDQIDALGDFLLEKGHRVTEISGRIKNRQAVVDDVNQNGGIVLIQSSTVEGYELPDTNIMVFASMDNGACARIQAEGRICRMNALSKNCYITLVSGDADEAILKSVENGKDFNPLLYRRELNN